MSELQNTQARANLMTGKHMSHVLAHDNYAAQAVADGGRTTFRLGEFPTEEEAEMACEDYVLGVPTMNETVYH